MNNTRKHRLNAVFSGIFRTLIMTATVSALIYRSSTGEVSSDAYSTSMGNARSIYGGGIDVAAFNPALLGAEMGPREGIRFFPLTSFCIGLWSDKLALTPYKEYFHINKGDTLQRIINQILVSSFDIAGTTPEESSRRIRDKIKGGASVYAGMNFPLLGATFNRWAVDIRTSLHTQINLPEAPFLLIFSNTDGLREGADLPLSHLGLQARATTDINAAYGIPFNLSEIAGRLNTLTQGVTDFSCASIGGGFTVSLGHSYVNLETVDGGIHYDEAPDGLYLEGTVRLKTAGTGLQTNWEFGNPFEDGFGFAGWGAGINAGALLYGEHSAVSISISRLGPMFWNNVVEGEFDIRTRDLTIAPLFDTDDIDLFAPENGGMLPDETDTLHIINSYASWMPTRLNLGFGYRFDFMHHEKKAVRICANYVNTTLEYEQSLAPWPGRSFIPRFTLAAENGFLWGIVPIRAGFIFGGYERIASTFGFGIGLPSFRVELAYKAIGTPYWYPKNGFEYAGGLRVEWGRFRDPDGDGIDNRKDRAPYASEDMDGFEDEDGIPDPDNDNDSIPDVADSCAAIPEDRDGFNDTDGCPDYDNDADSIADTLDNCPLEAEDIDSFSDEDGCPDPDNDADGIPDTSDSCPNEPEDIDGIADNDGCPDLDFDNDHIPDSTDQCPQQPENSNNIKDNDGCPEVAADFSEDFKRNLDAFISNISFSSSGELTAASGTALDSLGSLLGQYTSEYFIFWSDSTITDSLCLTRSQVIVQSLVQRGIAEKQLFYPVKSIQSFIAMRNTADHPLGIKLILPTEAVPAPEVPATGEVSPQKE